MGNANGLEEKIDGAAQIVRRWMSGSAGFLTHFAHASSLWSGRLRKGDGHEARIALPGPRGLHSSELWNRCGMLLVAFSMAMSGQMQTGELRISIADSTGLPVGGIVSLVSEVNEYRRTFNAENDGSVTAKRIPFGLYRVEVRHDGLAPTSSLIEIRSAIPKRLKIVLVVAPVTSAVDVNDGNTLLDPHRTGTINRIGRETIGDRTAALPGRTIIDLVNEQPGWLLEANGVLHPRGAEYQVQYVFDGVPLTDIRGPGFAPDFDADSVQTMSILTGGYPAEYGRKLGGIVELATARDGRTGWHGKAVAAGGSFGSMGAYAEGQLGWGSNNLSLSADGFHTDRFLDPPVEENYTNRATTKDLMAHFERDFGAMDRLGLILRRGQSLFLVPNEIAQQQNGQRQDRAGEENLGLLSYSHVFSANLLGEVRGMVRDVNAGLWSNDHSTPVVVGQDRGLRESYVKGSLSAHSGIHEIKVGTDASFGSLRESLHYHITDPAQFDEGTNPEFRYVGRAQNREQAAFAQDLIRVKNWTFSAGLRFDHYRLIVDETAWSPRAAIAYYWPAADLVLRSSYDRVFQTPAFENILVASSPEVSSLNQQVLRLPVRPSRGNFYEAGFAKGIAGKVRVDTNFYRRAMNNYADDDVLLNTGISFPIAFRKAEIEGVEVKVDVPRWGRTSGFVSYSNMVSRGYTPVTGGLFMGSDVTSALGSNASFAGSQDQRNTLRSRFRYDVHSRVWVALGGFYGSGLPVEFDGTRADAIGQYGQRIVDRVNFERGRVRPGFAVNASTGVVLFKRERGSIRLVTDVLNLTNRLNLINFSGLFSGTALGGSRSVNCRLQIDF